jgi:hypothetical protein
VFQNAIIKNAYSVARQIMLHINVSGFGGLGVACWPLVPKFAGSKPSDF